MTISKLNDALVCFSDRELSDELEYRELLHNMYHTEISIQCFETELLFRELKRRGHNIGMVKHFDKLEELAVSQDFLEISNVIRTMIFNLTGKVLKIKVS